jgi:hypothetical protein
MTDVSRYLLEHCQQATSQVLWITIPLNTVSMSTFEGVHDDLVTLEARRVVLGRSTHVDRILPHRTHRMIGAWCFLDHFGPDHIREQGGMWVPPHPHSSLQTVTWLFQGQGLHTDSLGSRQLIEPGQLNVMTAGPGICHAEITPPGAPDTLHGVQLWTALPDVVRRDVAPDFTHLADPPRLDLPGAAVTVFVGEMGGAVSRAPTYSPMVGVEVRLDAGASVTLPLRRDFEHGLLTAAGAGSVGGERVETGALLYLAPGRDSTRLENDGDGEVVALLIGGAPFEEEIVMWWNFVGRDHEEIVALREEWNATEAPQRFGRVPDFDGERLPAPPLPNLRLKPRGRLG